MVNILRFSICVLFQTSSKWLLKKQQQQTGTFNLTKGFISRRNFHNIRRKLDTKELLPTKGF